MRPRTARRPWAGARSRCRGRSTTRPPASSPRSPRPWPRRTCRSSPWPPSTPTTCWSGSRTSSPPRRRSRPRATESSQDRPMDLDVLFVGTAGSAPSARRGLPATLVRRGGDRLLFDCGEGTQRQLVRSTGLVELEEVFITHFHADHVLGLPGMLKTFALRQRERQLTVYGPRGLRGLFN